MKKVYVSSALESVKNKEGKYGQGVLNGLVETLKSELTALHIEEPNIWMRDFMPVKNSSGNFVQFQYRPSYMEGIKKYKDFYPDVSKFYSSLEGEVIQCSTILDGGNVELYKRNAIISDRVFRDNDGTFLKDRQFIYDELKEVLDVDRLTIVPEYPYDFTGHVDGLVRFIDHNTVLINDHKDEIDSVFLYGSAARKKVMDNWYHAFVSCLMSAGYKIKELNYAPAEDSDKSAVGIYLNFLRLEDKIVMPFFNDLENDLLAKKQLEEIYELPVVGVQAKELAKEGGVINCVTWQQ